MESVAQGKELSKKLKKRLKCFALEKAGALEKAQKTI